ncbi:HTH araC/xylS-type domain-containing protein [Novosphingobium lubricantis]|jgi:AraC-like DNA-binding protein
MVIDPNAEKVYSASGDFSRLIRTPDLRLIGLRFESWTFDRPFRHRMTDTQRACFYYVKRGAGWYRSGSGAEGLRYLRAGDSVGVEGHVHEWLDGSHLHPADVRQLNSNQGPSDELPLEIFCSSIDRSAAVLQRLPNGSIVIERGDQPYADILARCIELIELVSANDETGGAAVRKLAEVIMFQIVAFSRSRLLPSLVRNDRWNHDEFLLRALTAFFAQPGRAWTVQMLAEAAGLSRSAFTRRFEAGFGETPMAMLNRLRLHQASEMLKYSKASLHEIAAQIGFGSAPALVRSFKRQFGVSPGRWRQQEGQA